MGLRYILHHPLNKVLMDFMSQVLVGYAGSKNPADMGTIRRKDPVTNRESSET